MPGHDTLPVDIESILTDRDLTVRPPSEPVPTALLGTRLGEVMALLPRFTDGEAHRRNRKVTERLIGVMESASPITFVDQALEHLHGTTDAGDWVTAVCPSTLGLAFGVDPGRVVDDVSKLARGLGPGGSDVQIAAAIDACERLWHALDATIPDRHGRAAAIGLLFQGFDSVAALIGNGLISGAQAAGEIRRLIVDVPPIRNTRRFDRNGQPIVVDLEVATRETRGTPSYAFGFGPHRCPGQVVAFTIAAHALAAAPKLASVPDPVTFLPYPNANVPDLRGVSLDWSAS